MPTKALYSTTWPSFFASATILSQASSARARSDADSIAEPAASPSRAERRVMPLLPFPPDDIFTPPLLRGLLSGRRPAHGSLQLLPIGVKPVNRRIRIEGAGARLPEDFGVVDAGRHGAFLRKAARDVEQPPPRARDHDVARRQMLLGVIDDRAHAFGHGLVLDHDVADAGIAGVGALRFAVDLPIVGGILHRAPAAEPVGAVGLHIERRCAGDRGASRLQFQRRVGRAAGAA